MVSPSMSMKPVVIAFTLVVLAISGCDSRYVRQKTIDLRPRVLEVHDHHGGTRHKTIVSSGQWYQSYGPVLEVLDSTDGLLITTVEVEEFGKVGPISDMIIAQGFLWTVHAGDRVVRFDISNPRRPEVAQQWNSATLGIYPLEISEASPQMWVSGRGGTTSLSNPGDVKLSSQGRVGRVVNTKHGLVASAGRRVHRVQDGTYVGSATDLQPLPAGHGIEGGLVFVLQGSQGATVGLMSQDVREIDSETMSGTVRSVRALGDRLFVVGDTEIVVWDISQGGALHDPLFIPVKGARDIDLIRPNYYAVGGTFGRAAYRLEGDSDGEGDKFFAVKRSPGRLTGAITDRRRILAGSEEGNWMYLIGGKPLLSEKPLNSTTAPRNKVTLSWGEVSIDEDQKGITVALSGGEELTWASPNEGHVFSLQNADNRVWVGHDEGMTVLEFEVVEERPRLKTAGSITMEGPVYWLFKPQVGEEIAWVSVFGGIGSAEMVPDPEADPGLVRRVDGDKVEKEEKKMRKEFDLPPKD